MHIERPDGAQIAWQTTGSGSPVLLIMGLAYPAASWFRQVPALAAHHQVITIDNRGAGDTGDVVGAPYTVELMTEDCIAVLDAAGVDKAHVVGISMGGLMAQELAISHPDRVRSLVLMATHPGIAHSVISRDVIEFLTARATMTPLEAREASIPFNYAEGTARSVMEEDWEVRLLGTASQAGYAAQGGTALWSGLERLPQITAPTLVMYGEQDRLVVPENSAKIAAAIPGAQVAPVANANHVLTTDQPEEVNRLLLEWFASHEAT
ncbi:MAG: Lipase/esterase [Frankiales bacterium]|nr:Lipase/esterase [Frankiales bacterium]